MTSDERETELRLGFAIFLFQINSAHVQFNVRTGRNLPFLRYLVKNNYRKSALNQERVLQRSNVVNTKFAENEMKETRARRKRVGE